MAKRRAPQRPTEPGPIVKGVCAGEEPDGAEVYARMLADWKKTAELVRRRQDQHVTFDRGPIALTCIADLHLGSGGVDYERAFREAQIVADTPGMWLVLVGDTLDNFIVPKLMAARYESRAAIQDEWTLVRQYLEIVGKKLLIAVSGNHEHWHFLLSGIDYFKDVLAKVAPDAIYDEDDARVVVSVGKAGFPLRVRHHWRCRSQYNSTHGIEQGYRFDGGFAIGVGAHTHVSGLVREFNAAGATGLAMICGSYKAVDTYARQKGFAAPNGATAVTAVLFDDGAMFGTSRLDLAAKLVRKLRGAT